MKNKKSENLHYLIRNTVFGEITVVWQEMPKIKVKHILLPANKETFDNKYPKAKYSANNEIEKLANDIAEFFKGEDKQFNLGIIDLDLCSEFQRKVLIAEYGIPRGWVSTYGRIAKHIGNPQVARAVGRALATNPFPVIIPCHRAVRENGELGGYRGGVMMKKKLLEMEGINFINSKKIKMNKVYY
ncbi:MAG: methylated-DNA--[protein]-cysteine S-methyltransferase [Candidatus Freyarchaeum deiterrae]